MFGIIRFIRTVTQVVLVAVVLFVGYVLFGQPLKNWVQSWRLWGAFGYRPALTAPPSETAAPWLVQADGRNYYVSDYKLIPGGVSLNDYWTADNGVFHEYHYHITLAKQAYLDVTESRRTK